MVLLLNTKNQCNVYDHLSETSPSLKWHFAFNLDSNNTLQQWYFEHSWKWISAMCLYWQQSNLVISYWFCCQIYGYYLNWKTIYPLNTEYNFTKHTVKHKLTFKVSKGAKIRNRYNQVLHLTQDTNGKVTNSQLDTTNESQEVSPFPSRWPQSTYKQTHTKT